MSAVTEISGVKTAVGKLQELGGRMRSDDFDFKDNDVVNLEMIINAINELEEDRKLMHEKLETETIKCSILRHTLKMLPQKIRDETMMAVNAARQLNADALKNLRKQLESMNRHILDLETKSDNLEKENIVLHPENELLRQQHEEIISQLNQKLAEKATMQITLNESRDKVRQVNQYIVDLEVGMVQLKEDLIQERTEAKREKKRLRTAVTDNQIKTRHQKEQNVQKKKELDTIQENLIDSEGRFDFIRKSLTHYEASKNMLEADEIALTRHLEQKVKQNEDLHRQGSGLVSAIVKEQQEFEYEQTQLLNKAKTFEEGITKEMENSAELDHQKEQLYNDLKDMESVKEKDTLCVKELDGKLQSVKQNLTKTAEQVGHLYNENMKLTQETQELSESHKAVVTQFNRQIEELKNQLSKEKIERIEVQKRKEETEQALEDLKSAHLQFMKEVTESIQDGKKTHSQLSSEGLQLQKDIKEAEAEVQALQSSLKTAQQKYEDMYNTMQNKVDTLQGEIINMENEIGERNNMISEKTPVFEDLESFFSNRSEEYDNFKKSIVALKVKKTGLEDAIKRAKKERNDLRTPQETLRSDLKSHRTQVMSQIKHQGSDIKEIEEQIFHSGCKLRMILEENQKFEEACKKIVDDLADLEIQAHENEKMKVIAQNNLVKEKSEFINKWKADNLMQEVFESRDQTVAEAFGSLLSKAEKRENKIDGVTLKLRKELQVLSDFLNNIASRQSSESNKPKKPEDH